MANSNLLEINPDKLFVENSIGEIENTLFIVNNAIERRRIELRTLVGERYRDLIEAADKIEEMKLLSEEVISNVNVLNKNIASLKKPDESFKHINKTSSLNDSVTAQLKLIVDMPQFIWAAIEENDLIKASQLFLLGRHIKTGFTVDKKLKSAAFAIPFLEQQWSVLSTFPSIILDKVEDNLLKSDINPVDSCKNLVSAALLDLKNLIDKFLSYRSTAVAMKHDHNVKDQMFNSYQALMCTLAAVDYCFIEDGGKVWKLLNSFSQDRPIINSLDINTYSSHLPLIILNFTGGLHCKSEIISDEIVREKVNTWLSSVKENITSQGRVLVKNVTSLNALKQFCSAPEKTIPRDGKLYFGEVNIWNDVYLSLVIEREKQLISLQWNESLEQLCNRLDQSFSSNKNEIDLRWYVWKESSSDVKETGSRKSGLWLKSHGISPRACDICNQLNERIEALNNDIAVLSDSSIEDQFQLINHHHSLCMSTLLRLKEFVREFVSRADMEEVKLATLARLLQCMCDLCPSLQKCLTNHSDQSKGWHQAKTLLNSESLYVWSRWEEVVCSKLEKQLPSFSPSSLSELLSNIPQWELTWIEEGEGHRSQLQVPSSISLHLHCALQYITLISTRAFVPRLILENVLERMVQKIVQKYPDKYQCQAESLQALLDIKFLTTYYVATANKELISVCQLKIKQIENEIDPFDLDVYSPHIHTNVKATMQRTQCMFGGVKEHMNNNKVSEDPCIVPISKSASNVNFPFLPVTNPAKSLHLKKPKASKVVGKVTESSEVLARATNVASSFFNEWFS